jgi:hypothetical protein
MQSWPAKDPDEEQWFTVTWDFPDDAETVVTSEFTVVTGDVTIVEDDLDGNVARVKLSGGTLGEVCRVLNRVTTSTDESYDSTQRLRIRAK